MKKILALASIIAIAFYSCKKDPKINITNEVTGTWSLHAFSNSLDPNVPPVATSAQYPCVSDDKIIFNSNGSITLPPFGPCYISPKDAFGNASSISRGSGISGTWSLSGNSVYTTTLDNSTGHTYKERYDLSNNNGQLQLKAIDTVNNGTLTSTFVKQ